MNAPELGRRLCGTSGVGDFDSATRCMQPARSELGGMCQDCADEHDVLYGLDFDGEQQ